MASKKKKPIADRGAVVRIGRRWFIAWRSGDQWHSPSVRGGYGFGRSPEAAIDQALGHGAKGYQTKNEAIEVLEECTTGPWSTSSTAVR